MTNSLTVKKRISGRDKHKMLSCYIILLPSIIGFLVFTLYPMLWAASKSFFYYTGTPSQTKFVGIENFIRIVTKDTVYWNTWLNTFMFAIGKLPIELPLAMLVAICLHGRLKGAGFYRTMFYLPCVISVAIVGLIFTNLFDYFGFINAWLVKLGVIKEPIEWFTNYGTAMTALIFGAVWNTFGTNVLYFLAAMANVPEELYESARLDGASGWTTFWKITLPMMAPVLQTILLLSLTGTIHTSDYILVTTNGAPHGSTFTVMAYIVSKFVPGFADAAVNIGYGCAMSIITSVLMVAVALTYSKLSNKMQNIY